MITDAERKVIEALSRGGSNKEIARVLGISHLTVKNHIYRALRKMRCKDRTHLVAEALRGGLIA